MTASSADTPVWLITGASRGLGRAIAQEALHRGERVVATARRAGDLAELSDLGRGELVALELDVTDSGQVHDAIDRARSEFGRVDIVVNNAGYGLLGALEEHSDSALRDQFETNLFGTLNVTRAALPVMRSQGSGHIIQMSSLSAVVPNPGESAYAGSKAAVEAISASLAQEVADLGIRVTIVEPGPVRTEFAGASLRRSEAIADYAQSVGAVRELLAQLDGAQPNDPARAARVIVEATHSDSPPLRLPLGEQAFAGIREHLEQRVAELDATEAVGAPIAFAG